MSQNNHPYRVVDAFTDTPFGGNPAAVLVLEQTLSDRAMQTIAAEMNLSETAFVYPLDETGARLIRWFTPADEVPLCGHATLASARVLQEDGQVFPLRFTSASGPLHVHLEEDGRLRLDFPADPPVEQSPPHGMMEALGLPESAAPQALCGRNLWLVRVSSEADVLGCTPNMTALKSVDAGEAMGLAVTAPGDDPEVDFVSRFFAPWVGVNEDPVTGVAHTVLTPYWAGQLGMDEMEARQVSKRGGALRVRSVGDRAHLMGHAVIVARGDIELP